MARAIYLELASHGAKVWAEARPDHPDGWTLVITNFGRIPEERAEQLKRQIAQAKPEFLRLLTDPRLKALRSEAEAA